MKNLKYIKDFISEGSDDNDWGPENSEWVPLQHDKKIPMSEVKKIAWESWYEVYRRWGIDEYSTQESDKDRERIRKEFEDWWSKQRVNENVLPRPYPKTKCLECGESIDNDLKSKIGHLFNKHNCKPSINDYKAKKMLKEYFF